MHSSQHLGVEQKPKVMVVGLVNVLLLEEKPVAVFMVVREALELSLVIQML